MSCVPLHVTLDVAHVFPRNAWRGLSPKRESYALFPSAVRPCSTSSPGSVLGRASGDSDGLSVGSIPGPFGGTPGGAFSGGPWVGIVFYSFGSC